MKIALPNYSTIWKNPQKNLRQKENLISEIMKLEPETELIIFPELSFHGFVTDEENQTLAETETDFCITETQKLAKKYNVHIVAGFIEKNKNNAEKPFNTAFVINSKGELLTKYRKNKLFTASKEPELYSTGTELSTFEINQKVFGLSICFDLRFGEIFQKYRDLNADVVINIANWIDGPRKPQIYQTLASARAIEYQCLFIATDRIEKDPNVSFTGEKGVFNPLGENILEKKSENFYIAEIDFEEIQSIRKAIPMC